MSHQNIYEVINHQLVIKLPQEFKNNTKVLVTIDDISNDYSVKLMQMKKAALDPLFLADIKEVSNDFNQSDKEVL